MAFGDNFRGAVAELQGVDDDLDEAPRGADKQRTVSLWRSPDTEHFDAPEDDMEKYWRAFETTPYVRQAITSFAREVVEPGWFVEAGSKQAEKELAEWLREVAYIDGIPDNDFSLLLKKVVIQREVRGTAIIEHVGAKTDNDAITALRLLNPGTFSIYTKPDTTILWAPDDDAPSHIPRTDGGRVAPYVQFDDDAGFSDKNDIPFARDELTKITRDSDVGDVFGTSRLESVFSRIRSLRKKLEDLDQSIEQTAWPTWIIQFGSDEDPWHPDDIDDFMAEEDPDSFTPGTKHGVQGDIEAETIGGEVPDIEYSVNHDVNHILSIMPMPKAATGFAEDVNQFVTRFQSERIDRQKKEARRELEHEFNKVLKMKAEQLGHDTDDVQLRVAPPGGEEPGDFANRGTTIRYVSNVGQNEPQEGEGSQQDPSQTQEQPGSGNQSQQSEQPQDNGE